MSREWKFLKVNKTLILDNRIKAKEWEKYKGGSPPPQWSGSNIKAEVGGFGLVCGIYIYIFYGQTDTAKFFKLVRVDLSDNFGPVNNNKIYLNLA